MNRRAEGAPGDGGTADPEAVLEAIKEAHEEVFAPEEPEAKSEGVEVVEGAHTS